MAVYEVFQQEKEGGPMVHGGSVEAPDAGLAAHYAREFYGRRKESLRLWVVLRDDVVEVADPDLLQPPLERDHRRPEGYPITDRLRAARERAGNPGPGLPLESV